ncbi:Hsp20/alpha crystallin family protein [Pelotomaculum propionicicum]|mgnify:CR=1 FL=1|uniref:18 kDa heat shock protein n=1 Tax=Pelotomaculum propionicicum TaxID=258475 RepID=A0A4Y7RR71_9FIRM|nr:Hsp20/alpha crystallin family protein [Pelotomaculum propionicicum]NLI14557.1 Hsp20/alpha crystallin family protein [Peptococcaceae bacterium]TEB11182.1 18 kDa heat shock protein [Pelotomaculum propionicicum]
MALVRWDPFRELAGLQNSIARLFDENVRYLRFPEGATGQFAFPVDIKDTPEAVQIRAELPGMNKEDIKINLNDNILTIQGERKKEEKEEGTNFIRIERSYGSFSRSFTIDIPVKQNEIKASYQEGVLEIILPKEAPAKQENINIKID